MTAPRPLSTLQIAQVCHEATRGFQRTLGQPQSREWDNAGTEMQQSVVHGVKVAQESTEHGPEELHRQWRMVREQQGWVYGDVKDEVAKTHPNLRPYNELPLSEQLKDSLFIAIVRALSP